jgi:hypothetical protein
MIRPFELADFFLVCRLQKRGAWLDPCLALAGSELPAWIALSAPFRWWGRDVMTYVCRAAGGGIVQVRMRPGRPEADIAYLAPAPTECTEEVEALWDRLLAYCVQQAGGDQVQRLFACIPEHAEALLSQFRRTGFVSYARDEVYLLGKPGRLARTAEGPEVRLATPADDWSLHKLHSAITPRLVQQAEGLGGCPGDVQLPLAWETGRWDRLVLVRDGETAGLVLAQPGYAAHFLSLWGDFQDEAEVWALLQRGLVSLVKYPPRPVYGLVREYQSGVRVPLAEQGAQLVTTWSCLVKHTVVRAREPARRAWVAREPRPEPSVPGAIPSGAVSNER